jgi:hypothetical protein
VREERGIRTLIFLRITTVLLVIRDYNRFRQLFFPSPTHSKCVKKKALGSKAASKRTE